VISLCGAELFLGFLSLPLKRLRPVFLEEGRFRTNPDLPMAVGPSLRRPTVFLPLFLLSPYRQ